MAVEVVRCALNLHMYNSTHQNLFFSENVARSPGSTVSPPTVLKNRRSYKQKSRHSLLAVGDRALQTTSEIYGLEELLGPVSKTSPVLENGAPTHHLAAALASFEPCS